MNKTPVAVVKFLLGGKQGSVLARDGLGLICVEGRVCKRGEKAFCWLLHVIKQGDSDVVELQ